MTINNLREKYFNSIELDASVYEHLKEKLHQIAGNYNLLEQPIDIISARTLTPEECIGTPKRKDFPLVKGKEVMIEARFINAAGQAFTDLPGSFNGKIKDVLALDLSNNFERAIFISSVNAVLKHLKWIDRSVHCKNEEPEKCAENLVPYVREIANQPRIAFIGFQPAMIENLARYFELRVADLDPANVGKEKYGVLIEPVENTKDIIAWSELILATGTTVVNNTFIPLMGNKPVIFYGVTISGVAFFTGCRQYCYCGH